MADTRVKIMVFQHDGIVVSQYLLGEGVHAIGRDPNSAIYVESEYISSEHAKLYLTDEGIFIEDLNSTSGTFLDDITVRGKLRLNPGQRLRVGDLYIDLQLEAAGDLAPGVKIGAGRYQLNKELGRGAMGQVWLAQDTQLDELVAIKVLPGDVANDAVCLLDLKREVQKNRKLSHDNIIRIHDLIQLPGENPFVSLEYVEGTDLHAIQMNQSDRIFGWEEVKPYVLQLCAALDYAHERKIVHRDLKPSNIMITNDGVLKLADFGIAATIADTTGRSSMTDIISGTPQFMSPQQMLGEPPKASDDIYALGATMYCLLTGRPPFHTGDIAQQSQHVTPAPLEQRLAEFGLQNEVPDYVNDVVMSCLAKDPTARPTSAGAIDEWIRTKGQSKRPAERKKTETGIERMVAEAAAEPAMQEQPAQAQTEATKEKKSPMLVVAAALIVVAGLGWFFMGGPGDQDENQNTGQDLQSAGSGTGKTGGAKQAGIADSLKEGLVAYYPFNGNAKDESGNGNDGEAKGATLAVDRHGKENKAYQFKRSEEANHIEIPNPTDLHESKVKTISVWIQVPNTGHGGGQLIRNYSDDTHGENGWKLAAQGNTKPGSLFIIDERKSRKSRVVKSFKFNEERWYHLVSIDNDSQTKLYLNGREIASQKITAASATKPNTRPLLIGGFMDPTRLQGGFNGKIDDVRIYDRALSEEEITALYDLEKPKTDLKKGLVAYYPFNGNAKDESGNGNDGDPEAVTLINNRHGKKDSAYSFEGPEGFISAAMPSDLAGDKPFTTSMWINVNSYNKDSWLLYFGQQEIDKAFHIGFDEQLRIGYWDWRLTNNGANTGYALPINQWIHLMLTWDNNTLLTFINGEKIHETNAIKNRPSLPINGELTFGSAPMSGNRQRTAFDGSIDDVRIYNRALSAEEVKALYDFEKVKE
ncbi:protein kinase [Verrucomicrobia bacterium]|nr:protein kinase [Verrucomicrobiota bacterium]